VYSFALPAGTWDVTLDTIGSTYDTVLGVGVGRREDCGAALFQSVCNDDLNRDTTRAARVWLHRVESSVFSPTYVHVLVDSFDSGTSSGEYVLNVRLANARGDSCPFGGSLDLDISGGGSLLGFQTNVASAQRGSCSPSLDFSGEAVLFLRGPDSGNVSFDIYSASFVPTAYLRSSPCATGTELACEVGAAVGGGFNRVRLSQGVSTGAAHFLFVDGGRGAYTVYFDPT
jgi:hypothetical protein